ncbi:ferrous iron transport protein A [Flexibacter flexilis DSM 6793]|uniref:Ferrous iron transport protein A n=1 Tax=Flexibacter flexilis DSM 6793 TaxID=927664 RepID=A0A1I1GV55_9BACT|nr:FeoA family protein [Flexibacter flexilis]SFC15554.1 ferrous iron transport protein A [Flexibacter flexilis DSM 6793]
MSQPSSPKSIADLKVGQKGRINAFTDAEMSLKLLEMGCLPGSEVSVVGLAPLGSPMCINVSGYNLALRREEAATILIQ